MEKLKTARNLWGGVLAAAVLLALTASPAVAGNPTETIKNLTDEVHTILRNPAYQGPEKKRTRVDLVKKACDTRFDYREMARISLGDCWDGLSLDQRDEFVQLFTQLLESSYADRLDEFAKTEITLQGEIVKGDTARVNTLILPPNDKIPVTFALRQKDGAWKIYDLTIEGVSLATNFRSQFEQVIGQSSFAQLKNCLKTQAEALK